MEPWRSEGDHQVSCLPCGHLYGFSCISKWLQRPVPTTKHELAIEGGRLFAMDFSYQNLILSRRISAMGGMHMLNKINLINPRENEDIHLPPSTKAVKDIQISPCGRFTLLASLGKKLSIVSMESNNIVMTYNLRVPAWSCSWDLNSPHYVYAGLQNGMLLVFDMRGTLYPLQSMTGPVPGPIHTIYSLAQSPVLGSNSQKLLTASSMGPCVWNTDAGKRLVLPLVDIVLMIYLSNLAKCNYFKDFNFL